MDTLARFEFIAGPMDTEKMYVPATADGGPLDEVYINLDPPIGSRRPLATRGSYPRASPYGFTGRWAVYRLKLNPASPLRSTFVFDRYGGPHATGEIHEQLDPAPAPVVRHVSES